LSRLLLDLDQIADLDAVARHRDPLAVHGDVAVADELARGKDGGDEFGAVDHGVEPALEQRDHGGAGVALETPRLVIDAVEVPLRHVGVVALELLFGAQLHAVVRQLALAALAVLSWAVFALVDRRFRPAPDVLGHTPVDLARRLMA